MDSIHIALAPEVLGHVLGIPITNTLVTSIIAMLIVVFVAWMVTRNLTLIPTKGQSLLEVLVGGVYDYVEQTLESKQLARKYFPLIMTIFMFVLVANWLEFVPGIGSITYTPPESDHHAVEMVDEHAVVGDSHAIIDDHDDSHGDDHDSHSDDHRNDHSDEHADDGHGVVDSHGADHDSHADAGGHHGGPLPLFRSVNTDLNMTLAISIIAFFVIEFAGILALGIWKYGGKFFNFTSPIGFVVGIIEFISELARLISFSFRLFGNIFAGEVLIVIATFFVPIAGPIPLVLFEVFVGFIQAAIFALLTLFFIKLAVSEPH